MTSDWAPWTLAVGAAALVASALALGASPWAEPLFASRSGLGAGELWRLLTGSLVHGTAGHLARDVSIFVLVGSMLEPRLGRAYPLLLLPALALPPVVVLLHHPELEHYAGLSAVIQTQLFALVVWELRSGRRATWVPLLGAAILGKQVYEAATGTLLFPMDLGPNGHAVPVAHLAGAIVGLLGGVAARQTRPPIDSSTAAASWRAV